jgi:DUF1365 family protein
MWSYFVQVATKSIPPKNAQNTYNQRHNQGTPVPDMVQSDGVVEWANHKILEFVLYIISKNLVSVINLI